MSHLIRQKVTVRCDSHGRPLSFRWQNLSREIQEILDSWLETGSWWRNEAPKAFFQVRTAPADRYTLYRELPGGDWYLYQVED